MDIYTTSNVWKIVKLGGAAALSAEDIEELNTAVYNDREKMYKKEKIAIAQAEQEYINDGDIIILSYGTTVFIVAEYIDRIKKVTVIMKGLDIVKSLRDRQNVKVVLLGGIVDYSNSTVTGPTVPNMLDEFSPSKIIISAGGIPEDEGITNYDFLSSAYYS